MAGQPHHEIKFCTGALKLIAETFPWQPESHFVYTLDNHNSVLGIREEALAAGAVASAVLPFKDSAGSDQLPTPSSSLITCILCLRETVVSSHVYIKQ